MSITKLPYLIEEICAAVEIYYSGRTGQHYLKTAYILCDDYTELTGKLFLLINNPRWSDKKTIGPHKNCATPLCGRQPSIDNPITEHFKNYHDILKDVEAVFEKKRDPILPYIKDIHVRMKERRKRRNDFFHSTNLLDLSIAQRGVFEAFCDLFSYGELLFGPQWQAHVESSRNLDTMRILLLIEKANISNPTLMDKAMRIIQKEKRNKTNTAKIGVHITEFPEDFHLRISVSNGSNILRDKLKALLSA